MIAMVLFRGSYGQVCVVTFVSSEIKQFDVFSWWGFLVIYLDLDFKTMCFFGGGNFLEVSFFHVFGWFCFVYGFVNFGLELKQN